MKPSPRADGRGRPSRSNGVVKVSAEVPAYLSSWLEVASAMLDEPKPEIVRQALRAYLFPLLLLGSNVPQRLRPGAPVFSVGEDGSHRLEFVAAGDERVWTTGTIEVPQAVAPDLKGLVVDVVKLGQGFVVSHEYVEWRTGVRLPFTPGQSIAVGELVPERVRGLVTGEDLLEGWAKHETKAQKNRRLWREKQARVRADAKAMRALQNAQNAERRLQHERSHEATGEAIRQAERSLTPEPTIPPGSDPTSPPGTADSE